MAEERRYTQSDMNRIVQQELAAERKRIAEYRRAAARLAEIEAARAEGESEAVTNNHEATVAAAGSVDLDLARLIHAMAGHAGARDASIVAGLVDTEQVAYDEDGSPSNVEQLVADVLSARPYLRDPATGMTRVSADQGARSGRTTSLDDALRLLETAPAEFDRMVSRGLIPKDVFGGTDR